MTQCSRVCARVRAKHMLGRLDAPVAGWHTATQFANTRCGLHVILELDGAATAEMDIWDCVCVLCVCVCAHTNADTEITHALLFFLRF